MANRVLALDCDEVLFPFLAGFHSWLRDHGHATEQVLAAGLAKGLYETKDLLSVSWEHAHALEEEYYSGTGLAEPPVAGSVDGVRSLVEGEDPWEVHVVTARVESLHADSTAAWLGEHFPGMVRSLHFTQEHPGSAARAKRLVCEELGAATLVDDYHAHLLPLRGTGTSPLLFGLLPWSVEESSLPRARDWVELVALLSHLP